MEEYETLTEDIVKSNGEVIPAMTPETDEFGAPVMEEAESMTPIDAAAGLLTQLPGGVNSVGVVSGPVRMKPRCRNPQCEENGREVGTQRLEQPLGG